MASPSSDPEAKLERADKHVRALARMIRTFKQDAYHVDAFPAFWIGEPITDANVHDLIIIAEATANPPSLLWGPIIGDIVHDLRSALDQVARGLSVAFQAALGNKPPDPIPRRSPWRNIAFPVCRKSDDWAGLWGTKMWAADPALMAVLEKFQPYFDRKTAPDREPLAVLEELWNIDKHRHLHLVNATVELEDVIPVEPFPEAPHIDFEVISKRPTENLKAKRRSVAHAWSGSRTARLERSSQVAPTAASRPSA
jgi:hypothetical protein